MYNNKKFDLLFYENCKIVLILNELISSIFYRNYYIYIIYSSELISINNTYANTIMNLN